MLFHFYQASFRLFSVIFFDSYRFVLRIRLMKPVFKLIPDFILPNLEKGTYGQHLTWEDRVKGFFKVSRIHQNSEHFSDDCIAVYKAWSLKKLLWKTDDPKRVTKAKHRLITALRRNPVIEVLKKEPAYYRFQLRQSAASEKQDSHPNPSLDKKESEFILKENNNSTERDIYSEDPSFHMTHSSEKEIAELPKINETREVNLPVLEKTELDRICLSSFEMNEMPSDRDHVSENSSWSTGKCCCKVLLDNSLLSNEKCIWHGASVNAFYY